MNDKSLDLDVASRDRVIATACRTYLMVALGLLITGVSAYLTSSFYVSGTINFVVWIASFGLLIFINSYINKASYLMGQLLFCLFFSIFGFLLSSIFRVYAKSDIYTAFLITSSVFFIVSFYGIVTKRNLLEFGSFLRVGLFGVIIVSLINLFFKSPAISWAISYICLAIFTGLLAYHANILKIAALSIRDDKELQKVTTILAISICLAFMNLFLTFLNLMDRR